VSCDAGVSGFAIDPITDYADTLRLAYRPRACFSHGYTNRTWVLWKARGLYRARRQGARRKNSQPPMATSRNAAIGYERRASRRNIYVPRV